MRHLTPEQRYTIEVMLNHGYKQKEIAIAIGKDKSVVSREIKRNKDMRSGKYRNELANRKNEERHHLKSNHIIFTEKIRKIVDKRLQQQWSPELISNADHGKDIDMISHQRIYQ